MPTTLRALQQDPRPAVRRDVEIALKGVRQMGLDDNMLLNQDIQTTVDMLQSRRNRIADKDEQLSVVDKALMPLLQLHRIAFQTSSVDEQLEPSELDLLSFGVSEQDLFDTADAVGETHLGEVPYGTDATSRGLITGPKRRILVQRTVTIRRITRTVVFLVDTGGPATWVCHRTLAEFGLNSEQLQAQASNYVRGENQGIGLSLYVLDPHGAHHDLNILGMDYLMKVDAHIKINGQKEEVELVTNR